MIVIPRTYVKKRKTEQNMLSNIHMLEVQPAHILR